MINIEDDVKILKKFNSLKVNSPFRFVEISYPRLQKAISNILSDYTRQKQINEEHQKINGELREKVKELEKESKILEFQNKQIENYAEELKKYNKTVSDRIVEYKKNSIPMQVVIDKMEELNKEIKSCDEIDAIFKIKQQQILQELLEGERK